MVSMSDTKQRCSCCGRYPSRPLSIDALIVRNNEILLIKRAIEPYRGFWALPGGHVDWDETVKEAVIREVKEETNLDVKALKLLGVYSKPERHPNQSVAISYITDTQGVAHAGDDAKDVDFFPLDNLPENLAFDHKEIIGDYLKHVR